VESVGGGGDVLVCELSGGGVDEGDMVGEDGGVGKIGWGVHPLAWFDHDLLSIPLIFVVEDKV
jgi:hypothetical protein